MRLVFLTYTIFFLFGWQSSHAIEEMSEYQLKAAFLYNFAKFIHWPEQAFEEDDSPIIFGVLGENPFSGELLPLTKHKVRNRPIEVKYYTDPEVIVCCHILFVGSKGREDLYRTLSQLQTKPIVTVGEDELFLSAGGTIQFISKRGRLRFSVNIKPTDIHGIRFDSKLLALAEEVLE